MHLLLAATLLNVWVPIGPAGAVVNTVAADSVAATVVYAGTDAGLFKSQDGGATWRLAGSRPQCTNVTTVATDPVDSNLVYAGTATVSPDCIEGRQDGLFRSTDAASEWNAVEIGLPAASIETVAGEPGRIYFLSLDCYLRNNFFIECTSQLTRSDDFGDTRVSIFPSTAPTYWEVASFDVDRRDPDRLWAAAFGIGQSGLFRSDDGGMSWTEVSDAAVGDGPVAVDPRHDEVLLATAPGGSVRSMDGGKSWAATAPPGISFTEFRFDRRRVGIVYGIGDGGRIFRSNDDGVSWAPLDDGLGENAASVLDESADGRTLYASTMKGVFRLDLGLPPIDIPVTSPPAVIIRPRR